MASKNKDQTRQVVLPCWALACQCMVSQGSRPFRTPWEGKTASHPRPHPLYTAHPGDEKGLETLTITPPPSPPPNEKGEGGDQGGRDLTQGERTVCHCLSTLHGGGGGGEEKGDKKYFCQIGLLGSKNSKVKNQTFWSSKNL